MRSSQSQQLAKAQRLRERTGDHSKVSMNGGSATCLSHAQATAKACHRISFHPPSPSLHFSPRFHNNRPESCSLEIGKRAQLSDPPLVEHSPIVVDKPGATVNDGLFLALMMKNISTPTLVSTSNKGIVSSNSHPSGRRHPVTNRNGNKSAREKIEYFDVGLQRNVSGGSGSTEASSEFGSDDGQATIRSFLDFLEKCDAEFLRETARLSESIKYTKGLIKQLRDERYSVCADSGDSEADLSSSDEERTPVMRYTGRQGVFA